MGADAPVRQADPALRSQRRRPARRRAGRRRRLATVGATRRRRARDGRPGALSELWHGLPGANARAGARRGRALSRLRLVRHSAVVAQELGASRSQRGLPGVPAVRRQMADGEDGSRPNAAHRRRRARAPRGLARRRARQLRRPELPRRITSEDRRCCWRSSRTGRAARLRKVPAPAGRRLNSTTDRVSERAAARQ